jgi:uncharacterized membrane protein
MKTNFDLPGTACEQCKGKLALHIETEGASISALKIKCRQCGWDEDVLEKGSSTYEERKKQFNGAITEITKSLLKLKDSLPKNTDEWSQVVRNPKHPFTATLLTGLVIVLMEFSGFGVFMVTTWILSHLILNPVGWVLVPLIVAIGFTYRRYFKQDRLKKVKECIAEFDRRRIAGEITQEEYEKGRDKCVQDLLGE